MLVNLETIIDSTNNYSVQSSSNSFSSGSNTRTGTNDSHSTSSFTYTPGPFDFLLHPTTRQVHQERTAPVHTTMQALDYKPGYNWGWATGYKYPTTSSSMQALYKPVMSSTRDQMTRLQNLDMIMDSNTVWSKSTNSDSSHASSTKTNEDVTSTSVSTTTYEAPKNIFEQFG